MNPIGLRLIAEYLEMAKHGGGQDSAHLDGPLFHPVKSNSTWTLDKHPNPASIYRNIVLKCGRKMGVNTEVNNERTLI